MDALGLGEKQKKPKAGTNFIEPIWEYGRDEGFSITGGFVYRGQKIPALRGYYIVADWKTGNTWALKYDSSQRKVVDEIELHRPTQEDKFQPTGNLPRRGRRNRRPQLGRPHFPHRSQVSWKNAEWGSAERGIRSFAHSGIPHSAFRIPHFLPCRFGSNC